MTPTARPAHAPSSVCTPPPRARGPHVEARLRTILGLLAVAAVASVSALPAAADHLFVLTTDYETGSCSRLGLASPWPVDTDLEFLGPDPVARYAGNRIYVVNRFGADNLQVLDATTFNTLHQHSLGAGTNPQDIVVLGEHRAYVSRYDADTLVEIDPATGGVLSEISLLPLADADGSPEAARLFYDAPYLYVQIQRLDRNAFYEPTGLSYLGVIDTRDNTLVDVDAGTAGVQGIALTATNPFGEMSFDLTRPSHLLVPCAGSFGNPNDGGLEAVDLAGWESGGLLLTGAALGGDLLDFAPGFGNVGFAIVANSSFVTCLKRVDVAQGSVLGTAHCSSGYDLADVLVTTEGYAFVSDRTFVNPGIRVFDAITGAPVGGVLGVGLPPTFLLALRPGTSSTPDPISALGILGPITPNPSRDGVSWSLAGGITGGNETLEIVDALGRSVRRLDPSAQSWDGRRENGETAPAGAYWLRLTTAEGVESRGFRRLR